MGLPIQSTPTYKCVLPSSGKEVSYRPFLVKEEKLLMVALESKDDGLIVRSLKDVIRSCVYDDIDVNNLTTFDLEFLFLKLRAKSVGETVELKFPCEGEECKQTIWSWPLLFFLTVKDILAKATAPASLLNGTYARYWPILLVNFK